MAEKSEENLKILLDIFGEGVLKSKNGKQGVEALRNREKKMLQKRTWNAEQIVDYYLAGGWKLEEIAKHPTQYFWDAQFDLEDEGDCVTCSEQQFRDAVTERIVEVGA